MISLRAFACGSTTHDTAALLRGAPRAVRTYPAGAFLYEGHGRRVLFDTGYAPEPWPSGVSTALYRRLLPPRVSPGDDIASKLDPTTVTHVVISHLHPDHIGGLRFFPHAKVILSAGTLATLQRPRLRDGLLRSLLPEWFDPQQALVVTDFVAGAHGIGAADPFGDGDFKLLDLPGHTRGHLGALVADRLILAGDAAWSQDFLGQEDRIKAIPRMIVHDHSALTQTAQALTRAQTAGVSVLLSHDVHPEGVELIE